MRNLLCRLNGSELLQQLTFTGDTMDGNLISRGERSRPSRSRSGLATGVASWEKVTEEKELGASSDEQKRTQSSRRRVLCYKDMAYDQEQQRPQTSLGLPDEEEKRTSHNRTSSFNSKPNLKELKSSTLWQFNIPHRNCEGNKEDTKFQRSKYNTSKSKVNDGEEKSDELDFTEKLAAFRCLIKPKSRSTTAHDISNEELKRARSFSEGIERAGDYVKFNANSLERQDLRSSSPHRPLNEFQLTYEIDKEINRQKNELNLHRYALNDRFRSHQLKNCDNSYSQQLLSSSPVALEQEKDPVYSRLTDSKLPKEPKRIIKRPSINTDRNDYERINREYEASRTNTGTAKNDSVHRSKTAEIIIADEKESSITTSAIDSYIRNRNKSLNSFGEPLVEKRPHSVDISRSCTAMDKIKASDSLFNRERAHSTTPSTWKILSDVGRASPVVSSEHQMGTSLKAHLDVLGASLSSLSSRINGGSESDLRSLPSDIGSTSSSSLRLSGVGLSGDRDNLFLCGSAKIQTHGNVHFDMNSVSSSIRDRFKIQTSASKVVCAKDSMEERSGQVVTEAANRKSRRLIDTVRLKQTNVPIETENDEVISCENSSNELDLVRKTSRSHQSPRQSNVSGNLDDESLLKSSMTEDIRKTARYISMYRGRVYTEKKSKAEDTERISQSGAKNLSMSRSSERRLVDTRVLGDVKFEGARDTSYDDDDDSTLLNSNNSVSKISQISNKSYDTRNEHSKAKRFFEQNESVRVISRKVPLTSPLKAVHPKRHSSKIPNVASGSREAESKRETPKTSVHGSKNASTENKSNDFTTKKQTEKKHVLAKKPPKVVSKVSPEIGNEISIKFDGNSLKATTSLLHRSQSSLGFSSVDDESKTLRSERKIRSHSSLGATAAKEPVTPSCASAPTGKSSNLRNKVQQLHKEIDSRINSEESAAHRTPKYIFYASSATDDSEDNFELSELISPTSAVTNKKVKEHAATGQDSLEDAFSNRKMFGPRGCEPASSQVESPDYFITSTPLKNSKVSSTISLTNTSSESFRRPNSNNTENDRSTLSRLKEHSQSSRNYLANNLRKIVAARSRLTPDLTTTSRNDDSSDEDSKPPRRPSSVGANHPSNNQDILSRLLRKMTGRHDHAFYNVIKDENVRSMMSKWNGHSKGQRMYGQDSPADSLIGHLDNPDMVRLLQKLYKADPQYRQIIMIKVQFFKAWQYYTVSSRQLRLLKESLITRADTFCYQHLLLRHYGHWKCRATHSINLRRAAALFQRHMLTKGFKALKWSVSRSKHQSDKIQAKVHAIMLKVTFQKWKTKAEQMRRKRMTSIMKCWRQYVVETQKLRHMQAVINTNIIVNVLDCWKRRYNKRVRHNMAFNYLRRTLLKHSLTTWGGYIALCKEKKEKYMSAVNLHQKNLLKTTFYHMVVTFKKSRRAKVHFRHQKLSDVFWAWRQASQICRAERQRDMAMSNQHWQYQLTKRMFASWHESLIEHRADKLANMKLCRQTFKVWFTAWQENLANHDAIRSTLLRNKLHRVLLTWRRNVVQLLRRKKAAACLIETCHLRQTLRMWYEYMLAKKNVRIKIEHHRRVYDHKTQAACFERWLMCYQQRVAEEKAHFHWSQCCARKLAAHWRNVCHKRLLLRLLNDTQHLRENRLMQVMFSRWLHTLDRRSHEKEKAETMRNIRERQTLLNTFIQWQTTTQRVLLIKPMVLRKERQLMEESFSGWHSLIKHKGQCKQSRMSFQLQQLRRTFIRWRHQYTACQVEKHIKVNMCKGMLLCFFQEWQFIILRKRQSLHFRQRQLMRRSFLFWKARTSAQLSFQARANEMEEENLELKRHCFVLWWENVLAQTQQSDYWVGAFGQRRDRIRLTQAFVTWRKHMHSALIARAYQKNVSQRLLLSVLKEWREVVSRDVSQAVLRFSERVGLVEETQEFRESSLALSFGEAEENYFGSEEEEGSKSLLGSFGSSFSLGSSMRRLFGEADLSAQGSSDRTLFLSGGLQDVMDGHQTRCLRLRELSIRAIHRLQHWPVCVAFYQWQEFVTREKQLKASASHCKAAHYTTLLKIAFRQWKDSFNWAKTAQRCWSHKVMLSSLQSLQRYKNYKKYTKRLALVAQHYCMLTVSKKYFIPWRQKAHDQRQEKHILHLWSSRTSEEMELYPLESHLSNRIQLKSLRLCFSLWLLKTRHIIKVRNVYHSNLLQWAFDAWHEWASYRHSLFTSWQALLKKRRISMAFALWKERLYQTQETKKRHEQAWTNYLLLIVQQWRLWTRVTRLHKRKHDTFVQQRACTVLSSTFTSWHSLTVKVVSLQKSRQQRLMTRIVQGWRAVIVQARVDHQKILQFQIQSYTLMMPLLEDIGKSVLHYCKSYVQVKRLFFQWQTSFRQLQALQQERTRLAENKALQVATVWRRKAQATRGRQFGKIIQERLVSRYFQQWNVSLSVVLRLYDKLDIWNNHRKVLVARQTLHVWKMRLVSNQARQDFLIRLLFTVFSKWHIYAKVSRERHIRGLALKKALQERSLHVYFQYWAHVTSLKRSVQNITETRLQLRILRSWHFYTRHLRYLRQAQSHMIECVNTRILQTAFSNMRWRADYCNGLKELAEGMVRDRERATMRAVMVMWHDRLDRILASRCYGHLLAVRVVRRWKSFVRRRLEEKQKCKDDLDKAVAFHHRAICRKILAVLKMEVEVSKLATKCRQRLCDKYARLWKTQVDKRVTAECLDRVQTLQKVWCKWRTEFSRRSSAKHVETVHQKYILSLIFRSWRKQSCKSSHRHQLYRVDAGSSASTGDRRNTSSQLPVPLSHSRSSSSLSPRGGEYLSYKSGSKF